MSDDNARDVLSGALHQAFFRHRPRVVFGLKLGATLLLLALMMRALDGERLYQAVVRVEWTWLIIGCLASGVFVALRIFKWIVLTRFNGMTVAGVDVTRAMLLALALGIITPGRVGEVIAVAPFSADDKPRAVFAYVYDRVCELCVVLLFSIPAALMLPGWFGLVVSAGILAACLVGMGLMMSTRLRVKMAGIGLLDRFPRLRAGLEASIVAPPAYWALVVVTYVVAYALVVFFMLGAEDIADWRAVFILPVVTLSNLISITIGGLGVREGLAAALSPMVSLTPEVAAAAFFLSFFWTRVVPGMIGLGWSVLHVRTESRRGATN